MQGQLFTQDFLHRGIRDTPPWQALADDALARFTAALLSPVRALRRRVGALTLTQDDFALVNPNTGAAPIFRARRDADLTLSIYREQPVLVRHGGVSETQGALPNRAVWPLKYQRMFDMTNDSQHFLQRDELAAQGWRPGERGRWQKDGAEAVPLYVGRMVHQYDHRHASVTINDENLHNAASGTALGAAAKADPTALPTPQYWLPRSAVSPGQWRDWAIGFRDIARATDMRTVIAAIVPGTAAGNTLPLLLGDGMTPAQTCCLLANLNALVFDYIARQKAQTTHLNWYIVEQLPVITPPQFELSIGPVKIADFIREQVLRLSYTAHNLAPFALDLGHLDANSKVKPPFIWDAEDRRHRRAALDGLYMHLYGLDDDDAAHVLDSFPIVREQDRAAFGRFRTRDEMLAQLQVIRGGRLALSPVVEAH